MVIQYSPRFKKIVQKLDASLKERVKKQIRRIVKDPSVGKPMRFSRRGTRELYVPPFRLSYAIAQDDIIFLELYHKDAQ